MSLKNPKNRQIFNIFCLFCLCIFSINLSLSYHKYQIFMDKGEQELVATVISSYEKLSSDGKKRQILRLKTDEFTFYTLGAKTDDFKSGDNIFLSVINLDVGFKDYISSAFYMPSFSREKLPRKTTPDINQKLQSSIYNQHENSKIAQLYSALFLGTNIDGELRDDVSNWGIAHLIAISGYHLGVISAVCFFVLKLILKPIYARYLPFRSYIFDISIAVFLVLCFYFYLIGFIPSFLRAFLMSVAGFYMICKRIKILNFYTLFGVILFGIAMFPQLLFSVGFYFSCLGVFYIFVYLLYFAPKFGLLANSLLLNLYVFFAMEVAVLYFFPLISLLQLSVLALNYLFGLFYPLSFVLHLFGYGGIFDEILSKMLAVRLSPSNLHISTFVFLLYNAATLLCIKFKASALLPPLFGVVAFLLYLLNFS
ncbi:ComEC/Rec2 family competence protein [Campylobacter concisus]|uniref:ComEC/Rec2 family competence protein n=1 Tax=Campylobacter concisus TaxID=199 RepID=UPI000CD919DB|nr:ComEC/Rec2 family competence protein [Campylobacter concisus]